VLKSFSVSARQLEEEVAAEIVTYCKSISAGPRPPGRWARVGVHIQPSRYTLVVVLLPVQSHRVYAHNGSRAFHWVGISEKTLIESHSIALPT
jgi:hypothetical protein